jgi:hypothetical protein
MGPFVEVGLGGQPNSLSTQVLSLVKPRPLVRMEDCLGRVHLETHSYHPTLISPFGPSIVSMEAGMRKPGSSTDRRHAHRRYHLGRAVTRSRALGTLYGVCRYGTRSMLHGETPDLSELHRGQNQQLLPTAPAFSSCEPGRPVRYRVHTGCFG